MVKKILVWFINRYKLQTVLSEIQNTSNILSCNSVVENEGGQFYSEAQVVNLQNDASKIRIGEGTHIRGMLHIFRYGGEITIGQDCYVGDHSRIWSGESVRIGNFVQISHNVNIIDTSAHEIDAYERAERYVDLINNGAWQHKGNVLTAPIIIEDYVWISFNVSVLRGVHIGQGAIIGAGSVVTKNVPAFTLVAGNPAVVVKQLKKN